MSANGAEMDVDAKSDHKVSRNRDRSTDTHRTRRSSHRSQSRDKDRDRSQRHRDRNDRTDRRRSRDRGSERSHRDRDRSRERSHRDRDRERDRRHRDRGNDRDRERRDKDREDKRRKRDEEDGDEERAKRKKHDEGNGDAPVDDAARLERSERSPRDRDRRNDDRRRSDRDRDRPKRTPPPPPPPPPVVVPRASPSYAAQQEDFNPDEPKEDDSEARSVFVSQLAARLTARDLGYFFEDKLGENSVMDARIVTDRLSRRSKGIGYVELRTLEFVDKAINLSGTVVMGLPIKVQHTEAERNRTHAGEGSLHLPPGVSMPHGPMQLYVGSLHFNLTESDIKQVFEPFGELEFVDLHRDPMTGRSKGYCFIQYKRGEDAKMALEQMEGFELAGRQLRVNTVHEKGSVKYTQQESLEDTGGGNLNAASRQALMQKLARIEPVNALPEQIMKPTITQTMQSRSVLMKNMFDPAEESGDDWDKELAEDVKGECHEKYGQVSAIKVEKDSEGEIYVKFETIDAAKAAVQGLNGRWFGGKQVSAVIIADAIMQAHQ